MLHGTRRALLGTARGWNPCQTAGLHAWYRADQGLYQDSGFSLPALLDGAPVGGVRDLSGSGHDAVQATPAARPLLKLAVQNARPVLRFDGINDLLQAATVNVAQPDTIFMVADLTPNGDFNLLCDGVTNRQALYYDNLTPAWSIYAGANINDLVTPAGAWMISTVLFNGASSQLWQNGTSRVTGNAGATALTDLLIGPGGTLLADIAEMLIYDRALTTAERRQVEEYLSHRYAIPVA